MIQGKQNEILTELKRLQKERISSNKALKNANNRKKEGKIKDNAIKYANGRLEKLAQDIEYIGNKYKLIDLQKDYDTENFGDELKVGLHELKVSKDLKENHKRESLL